ncbi:hypothetical protein ABZ596_00910, partial [Streptomyces albidoflavus]
VWAVRGWNGAGVKTAPEAGRRIAEAVVTAARGAEAVGDPIEVLPVVFHALWHGLVTADLEAPLHERVLVGPAGWRDPGPDAVGGAR